MKNNENGEVPVEHLQNYLEEFEIDRNLISWVINLRMGQVYTRKFQIFSGRI